MVTKEGMDIKELVLELKKRALGGYGLVIAPFPEERKAVFTYASEGILIMTGQAPVFVVEVNQIDERVIDKCEEIAKIETITRIVFGIENGWIESALVNIQNDLYAVPNIQHKSDMMEHLYLDDIPLDTDESKLWFRRFLYAPEKTEFPADIYLFQKETGVWMKTEPKDRVRLFGRGTVDEVLEKEKNRLKDIAFRYPETYAVVKKLYGI